MSFFRQTRIRGGESKYAKMLNKEACSPIIGINEYSSESTADFSFSDKI